MIAAARFDVIIVSFGFAVLLDRTGGACMSRSRVIATGGATGSIDRERSPTAVPADGPAQ
jgi:hypothetical protein